MFKWRLYWASVITGLFGVTIFANRRRYKTKPWTFVLGKSVADCSIVGLLAMFCPSLLIAISVMWIAERISPKAIWSTIVSVLAGIGLGAIGGVFLEALLVIGSFASHLVSREWLANWHKRGQPAAERKAA
jgi:hypothetical protein